MPSVRLNRVLDFIDENLARDIRLQELANVAGMSLKYFCELFRESTGLSAHQYVLRRRIERAKQFLRNSSFTVATVSAATGFRDQSHFTKVFRRLLGVTPVQFRSAG